MVIQYLTSMMKQAISRNLKAYSRPLHSTVRSNGRKARRICRMPINFEFKLSQTV